MPKLIQSLVECPSADAEGVDLRGHRGAFQPRPPAETEEYDPKQGKLVPLVPPLAAKSTIVVFDDTGEVIGTVDPE